MPVIRLIDGELPRVVDEAEAALLATGARNYFYERGDLIVRPIKPKLKAEVIVRPLAGSYFRSPK